MTIKLYTNYEHPLAKWCVGLKSRLPRSLEIIAERLYPEEIKTLRNLTCPFCGRRFRGRSHLLKHLTQSWRRGCSESFYMMLADIIETHRRVHYILMRERKGRGYRLNGRKFARAEDAVEYALTLITACSQ